ncbi:hypothetical protein [Kitasatospora sp. NPDC086791]|uniref:hypothetical protein n=1 Tax=Kitasatospora sp. NPDC086791 TaxID=3155178 RepID=UPI003418BBBA
MFETKVGMPRSLVRVAVVLRGALGAPGDHLLRVPAGQEVLEELLRLRVEHGRAVESCGPATSMWPSEVDAHPSMPMPRGVYAGTG